jgi:hypothetical protein
MHGKGIHAIKNKEGVMEYYEEEWNEGKEDENKRKKLENFNYSEAVEAKTEQPPENSPLNVFKGVTITDVAPDQSINNNNQSLGGKSSSNKNNTLGGK